MEFFTFYLYVKMIQFELKFFSRKLVNQTVYFYQDIVHSSYPSKE